MPALEGTSEEETAETVFNLLVDHVFHFCLEQGHPPRELLVHRAVLPFLLGTQQRGAYPCNVAAHGYVLAADTFMGVSIRAAHLPSIFTVASPL